MKEAVEELVEDKRDQP